MSRIFFVMISCLFLSACNTIPYKEAEQNWNTHEDVASWMNDNFRFDTWRQQEVLQTMKKGGVWNVTLRSPMQVYKSGGGYCADSANFAYQQLKRINPEYNPRFVFISNDMGRPHHWVTAFDYQDKLYVMDYGTGSKWAAMQGLHGPYNDLSEYKSFLSSLSVPGFKAGAVYFRDFPGTITE